MSYTSVGRNKVYASIEDLPQNQKIVNGDRILIQTEDGTALVDYSNIKIDLEHVTFATQITSLIEFTSTVDAFVDTMQAEFMSIKQQTVTMKNDLDELKQQMNCCKLMFKLMMGLMDKESTPNLQKLINENLSGAGLTMYTECVNSLKQKDTQFTFINRNLLV